MFDKKDEERFYALCERMGIAQHAPGMFASLKALYKESPKRRYYTFSRIRGFLGEFDEARRLVRNPDAMEFALYFSNIIHDPDSRIDEIESAEHARIILCEAGISEAFAWEVHDLIIATWDVAAVPDFEDGKIIVDIMLTPLGVSADEFDENTRLILIESRTRDSNEEVAFMREQVRKVHVFLERNCVYRTEHFARKYGQQAVENIRRLGEKASML